jgi:adenylate cyclase
MGEDEAGTLAALKSHRKELIDPKAAQYNGRTIKLMGDGALMEFPSVIEAVTFSVEVQLAMRARNADVPEDEQILFRIGINIGDVIIEGDDIYGDGVNLAARLEGLAEPGGICVRRAVRNQVRDKLDLEFEDRGEIDVKNVARPIRVFAVVLNEMAQALATPIETVSVAKARRRWPVIAAGMTIGLLAVAGLSWWQPWAPDVEPAAIERFAFPLPEKPSIAVLPFDNLSGDPGQEPLADGLTEEIITALSKSPNLFVIARNSTFTYKGKAVPVKQVAEDLGVRFVLKGSLQRSADRVRINAQLIDALDGHHLWAERYDREFNDIFALQDDVIQNIMIALQVELTEGEELRLLHARAASPEAFEYMQKSRSHYNRFTKEDNAIARELAAKVVEISPEYPDPWAWMGFHHLSDYRFGWSADRKESFEKAVESAEKAYELDPELSVTNGLLGVLNIYRGRYDEAILDARKSVDLMPSSAPAIARLAWILSYAGQPDEAIPLMQQAMRLSPYYPTWFAATLGLAYMMTGDYQNAIAAHEELIKREGMLQFAYARLALLHNLQGDEEKAQDYAAELLSLKPGFTISGWSKVLLYKNQEDRNWELNALRKVGLPE